VFIGPKRRDSDTLYSKGFRSNLSGLPGQKGEYIDLEFAAVFADKIPLYFLSHLLLAANIFLKHGMIKVAKWWIHVMHWHPKVHLIFFNVVLIDFAFYGARCLLHIRESLYLHRLVAWFVFALLNLDLWFIFEAAFVSNCFWKMNLKLKTPKPPAQDDLQSQSREQLMDSLSNSKHHAQPTEVEANQPSQLMVVDYPATFSYNHNHFWHVDLLTSNLRTEQAVFSIKSCRSLALLHLARILLYQFLIISCQNASGLLLTVLALCEATKIAVVVVLQRRHRLFAATSLYLAELTQSLFLFLFIFLVLTVHQRQPRKGERIPDALQMVCVLIIAVAIVFEWAITIFTILQKLWSLASSKCRSKGVRNNQASVPAAQSDAKPMPTQTQTKKPPTYIFFKPISSGPSNPERGTTTGAQPESNNFSDIFGGLMNIFKSNDENPTAQPEQPQPPKPTIYAPRYGQGKDHNYIFDKLKIQAEPNLVFLEDILGKAGTTPLDPPSNRNNHLHQEETHQARVDSKRLPIVSHIGEASGAPKQPDIRRPLKIKLPHMKPKMIKNRHTRESHHKRKQE